MIYLKKHLKIGFYILQDQPLQIMQKIKCTNMLNQIKIFKIKILMIKLNQLKFDKVVKKRNLIKIIRKNKKHRNSKIKDLIFIKCGISLKDMVNNMVQTLRYIQEVQKTFIILVNLYSKQMINYMIKSILRIKKDVR